MACCFHCCNHLNILYVKNFYQFTSLTSALCLNPLLFPSSNTAPSAPPQDVSAVMLDDRRIEVSWSSLSEETQNGKLKEFAIYYRANDLEDGEPSTAHISADLNSATIDGLQPYTEYLVWITASTDAGEGPRSEITHVTTDQSSG